MYINGRVHGYINGYVEGSLRGNIRGEIHARVDSGTTVEKPPELTEGMQTERERTQV